MDRHPHFDSARQSVFNLGSVIFPTIDSALRAAYARLELSRLLTFEQAMSDPAYASGIRSLAEAIARRESPERIADACASHQLHFRLQFTQAFRAELRAAISTRERETVDAS